MKILILLHSTTGNTRLVTRHAAKHLKAAGHECDVCNIVKNPDPPDLEGVDLLGVSCPTMFCRGTFAMEQYLDRLPPVSDGRKPAFLMGTCAGEPGAHFALQAEQLAAKGYVAMGANWVMAPLNLANEAIPGVKTAQRTAGRVPLLVRSMAMLLAFYHPVLRVLLPIGGLRPFRGIAGMIAVDLALPDEKDRHDLERFLDRMAHEAEAGNLDDVPAPNDLHRAYLGMNLGGRLFSQSLLNSNYFKVQFAPDRCDFCGTCVKVCPVRTITQEEGELPRLGTNCTGCFTCFNYCPEGAINVSDLFTVGPNGEGQYKRPPAEMKAVFHR